MISVLLALLAQAGPTIGVREPLPAMPWVQTLHASCGSARLEVNGFGITNPLGRQPRILVNDRSIEGRSKSQLLKDLSHKSSVYRFQVLCGSGGGITLRIDRGEKTSGGVIRYWSSAAFFKGRTLAVYHPPEEADASQFFFR